MSECLDVSSAVQLTLVKGCPQCGNQSFRIECAGLDYRLVCDNCGQWAWLLGWPFD